MGSHFQLTFKGSFACYTEPLIEREHALNLQSLERGKRGENLPCLIPSCSKWLVFLMYSTAAMKLIEMKENFL